MRAGSPHVFERVRPDGTVIETARTARCRAAATSPATPTSPSYKHAEQRTARGQRDAGAAREPSAPARPRRRSSRRRASSPPISHDVLQPLNAARLFTSALRETDDARRAAPPGRTRRRLAARRRGPAGRTAGRLAAGRRRAARRPSATSMPARCCASWRRSTRRWPPARGLRLRVHAHAAGGAQRPAPAAPRAAELPRQRAALHPAGAAWCWRARRRGDQVALQVWDTGPGIPAHHLRQIFEEFHRYEQPFDWGEPRPGPGPVDLPAHRAHCSATRWTCARGSGAAACSRSRVPRGDAAVADRAGAGGASADPGLAGLRVLCVDNDRGHPRRHARAARNAGTCALHCADTVDGALAEAARARRRCCWSTTTCTTAWTAWSTPGRAARRLRQRARRAADRRRQRRAQAGRARAWLPGADQAGQAGLAAGVPGGGAGARTGLAVPAPVPAPARNARDTSASMVTSPSPQRPVGRTRAGCRAAHGSRNVSASGFPLGSPPPASGLRTPRVLPATPRFPGPPTACPPAGSPGCGWSRPACAGSRSYAP